MACSAAAFGVLDLGTGSGVPGPVAQEDLKGRGSEGRWAAFGEYDIASTIWANTHTSQIARSPWISSGQCGNISLSRSLVAAEISPVFVSGSMQ